MRLFGFINPTGRYPAAVVPVWLDESDVLHGMFARQGSTTEFGRELLPLLKTSDIKRLPDDWFDSTIQGHKQTDVCLLALSQDKLIAYPISAERKAISTLLADPSFASDQPFTRLAFAKLAGSAHLVVAELLSCACHLLTKEVVSQAGGAKARIEAWLQQERDSLAEQLGESQEARALQAELPTTLEALGAPTWWRGHVTLHPPQQPLTLVQIEDRRPSPKTAAILNLEPAVPDREILGIMARHLLSGTNYLFFHAPSASPDALDQLRRATDRAVETARRAVSGPLGNLAPPLVGTVKFFELDREWTGSPFVFYEEAAEGGTRVAGYRGVDVGASIARSYERLTDEIAFELLEALVSKAPSLHDFAAQHPERPALDFIAARDRKQR